MKVPERLQKAMHGMTIDALGNTVKKNPRRASVKKNTTVAEIPKEPMAVTVSKRTNIPSNPNRVVLESKTQSELNSELSKVARAKGTTRKKLLGSRSTKKSDLLETLLENQ